MHACPSKYLKLQRRYWCQAWLSPTLHACMCTQLMNDERAAILIIYSDFLPSEATTASDESHGYALNYIIFHN